MKNALVDQGLDRAPFLEIGQRLDIGPPDECSFGLQDLPETSAQQRVACQIGNAV